MLGDDIFSLYHLPHQIVVTTFRPDIFFYSYTGKKCIQEEFTVPFNDRVFAVAEGRARKY